MALISHMPSEVARALISLRQLGVAALGSLEHAEYGGYRQLRTYNSAAQQRGWSDRPFHRPKVYDASSAQHLFAVARSIDASATVACMVCYMRQHG
jgi:hypothetical protein